MRQHKFKVGQTVKFHPRATDEAPSHERYEITRLLPAEQSGFQYRIKGRTNGQERVVMENEIA